MFIAIGLAGFIVQIAAIALLIRQFGWPAFAATAVGLELAALQNFIAHSRWTWGDRPVPSTVEGRPNTRGWVRRFGRYQAAKTASLLGNLALTTLLVDVGLPPEIANLSAVLVCAIPNYLISEHVVFS